MKAFNLSDIELTKYLFFTGKGGVGKTSIACATAVGLADMGKKIEQNGMFCLALGAVLCYA